MSLQKEKRANIILKLSTPRQENNIYVLCLTIIIKLYGPKSEIFLANYVKLKAMLPKF